jgi:alpha-2-macroglobulin
VSVLQRLTGRIRPAFQALRSVSSRAAPAVLGEVDWRAPPWIRWTATRIHGGARAAIGQARQKPRQTALLAAATALVLGGVYAGWRWYENRPRPIETTFSVTPPERTCYECEPAGKPQPVLVRFSGSAAPLAQTGKDLDPQADLVRLEPTVKGTWRWDDDRQLRFQPAEDWPIGTRFRVTLAKRDFVAPHVHLEEYDFNFQSPAFTRTRWWPAIRKSSSR